jgi:hypothetical protein
LVIWLKKAVMGVTAFFYALELNVPYLSIFSLIDYSINFGNVFYYFIKINIQVN